MSLMMHIHADLLSDATQMQRLKPERRYDGSLPTNLSRDIT